MTAPTSPPPTPTEEQRTPRYVALHCYDAVGLPGAEQPDSFDSWWGLWECDDSGAAVRLVGTDHAEPEDKILVRDFRWVAEELNRVAAALRSERDALQRVERERGDFAAQANRLAGEVAEQIREKRAAEEARAAAERLLGEYRQRLRDATSALAEEEKACAPLEAERNGWQKAAQSADAAARAAEAEIATLRRALQTLSTHVTVHHKCPATGPCAGCDAVAAADAAASRRGGGAGAAPGTDTK